MGKRQQSCGAWDSSLAASGHLVLQEAQTSTSKKGTTQRRSSHDGPEVVDQFLRKHSCSDCFFGVTSTCKRRKNARHSSCRKAVSRFCCYAPGGRSGEYRDLPFAKGRGTFLVMPMPESSMVKVELVLSGMISDAATERGVTGIDPA